MGLKKKSLGVSSQASALRSKGAMSAGGRTQATAAQSNGLNQGRLNQQSGPLVYIPKAKTETEEEKIRRYERVIEKLRKMMEHEKRLLKNARQQYNKEMQGKTELELLLKQAVDKVKSERRQHRE